MCLFFVRIQCTLLKVISPNDFGVLFMSVIAFPEKIGWWVGGVSLFFELSSMLHQEGLANLFSQSGKVLYAHKIVSANRLHDTSYG